MFQSCAMERWKPIWIATLYISDSIVQKIQLKHNIDADLLIQFLVCNKAVRGRLIDDTSHGTRILVYVELSNDRYFRAFIDEIDPDYSAYSLRTAQFTSQIPIVGR